MDSSTSTRNKLWSALDAREEGTTCAQVLARLQLQDDAAAQVLAAEHALAQGAFGALPAFVEWFEKNWACTLQLTAALGHEPWMLQPPRAGDHSPAQLARMALRQIKATLCAPLASMRAKWKMWHAHPDMGYHAKVVRALLQQATEAQRPRIREKLHTAESTTTRAIAILRVFQCVLGNSAVGDVMRTMADQELKYRMAQRTAVQFLGLELPGAGGAKRKAPPAAPSTPPRPPPAVRVCTACGSPLRCGPGSRGTILAQE